jgi:hypothetical protein
MMVYLSASTRRVDVKPGCLCTSEKGTQKWFHISRIMDVLYVLPTNWGKLPIVGFVGLVAGLVDNSP